MEGARQPPGVGSRSPARGPLPAASGSRSACSVSPGKPSARATPSLSRGCFYPGRRRNPEVVDGFRCKRSASGPDTPGTRTAGERDSLPGRRVPLRGASLGRLPCAFRPGAGRRRWPPHLLGAEPGARRAGLRKERGASWAQPPSTARTVRPCSDLERLRRATFVAPPDINKNKQIKR